MRALMSRFSGVLLIAGVLLLAACFAPQTQLGSVSQDQVVIEQARQQQFALQMELKQTFRLQNVAAPLLRAGVPLCGETVRPVSGFMAGNAYRWKSDKFKAALSMGYNDTLIAMNVTPELAADEAGLKTGDRILAVNGLEIITGPRAQADMDAKLPTSKDKLPRAFSLTYRRGSQSATVSITPQLACAYHVQIDESDDINAFANGSTIFFNTGILRFVADDDELAVIVGHEIAHNAMQHTNAKVKNSMIGALIGAVADVAAATQGVDTDFTRQGAELGKRVFSQDFEREADYVGLYILALANRPIDDAPMLWRRMAAAHPGSIKFATSHPTTAERFVRLDKWRGEIDRKVAMGLPLSPEMKVGNTALASSAGAAPTRTALARKPAKVSQAEGPRPTDTPRGTQPSLVAVAEQAPPKAARRTGSIKASASPASGNLGPSPFESVSSEVAARAIIGAPSSESERIAAVGVFAEGNAYMGSHQWAKAEESFRKTLLLDGSLAKYHVALGSVLMILEKWKDAEAEYTAAVLLDFDNPTYRRLVKEARSKR